MALIRRAFEERGREVPEILNDAFVKIAELTSQRDKIFHYGIAFTDEGDFVTDEGRTIAARAQRYPISVKRLDDLAADTVTCWAKLVVWHRSLKPAQQHDYHQDWVEASRRSWLHKSPLPVRVKSRRQTKKPQSRQPKPSTE
jgi:hypothetical protein